MNKEKEITIRTIKEMKLAGNKSINNRTYFPRSELGYGLMDIRIEYGKELLRTLLHYRWKGDNEIKKIMYDTRMEGWIMKKILQT